MRFQPEFDWPTAAVEYLTEPELQKVQQEKCANFWNIL